MGRDAEGACKKYGKARRIVSVTKGEERSGAGGQKWGEARASAGVADGLELVGVGGPLTPPSTYTTKKSLFPFTATARST